MKILDINTWNRKQHYEHFIKLSDPYFGVVVPFNVTKAFNNSKKNKTSFFARYLHDCMKAINTVENLKYRIEDNQVVIHDVIHASATMLRKDKTFGFSFVEYDEDLSVFEEHIQNEKTRIESSINLYPPKNSLNCIHCSALPWFNFVGHKEPVSGQLESVPKIGFSKVNKINEEFIMNVSINVNHALVDGYHVSLFSDKFQEFLNQ